MKPRMLSAAVLTAAALVVVSPASGQVTDDEAPARQSILGKSGIDVVSEDGSHALHLWFRGQLRYSYPTPSAPRSAGAFDNLSVSTFELRRVRLKLAGNIFRRWLKYYAEYDVRGGTLLDFRFMLAPVPWFEFRVGQGKVLYNRERVDSSGRQQFVDRSIVNREFTADRQLGITVSGHLGPGSIGDSRYSLGIFNGNGLNARNDDSTMMWLARYQWNFLQRDLRFAQSDVGYHEKPTASLAFAALGNKSPYTRFSSSGGGQIDGFEQGLPGQYALRQFVEETAFKYRGFSFQQEYHWKQIEDTGGGAVTKLRGALVQAGYLPWAKSQSVLAPLEFAARYAWVDPDTSRVGDDRQEIILAVNWFFNGHDNKLTADLSRLELERLDAARLQRHRLRLQWDISF